jgi:hypothetical protein
MGSSRASGTTPALVVFVVDKFINAYLEQNPKQ